MQVSACLASAANASPKAPTFGGYHFDYTTALSVHFNANIESPNFSGGSKQVNVFQSLS